MILIWILLIAWGLWLLAPIIGKWLMRRMQRKMQRTVFRHMGIDPDAYEKAQKQAEERAEAQEQARARRRQAARDRRRIIPSAYGEYVKFTIVPLTGTEPWLNTEGSPVFVEYHEYQITDVRWEEIR